MRFHLLRPALLTAVSFLTGCQMTPYGFVAPYSYFATEPIEVVLPANAPSISNQFRHLPNDGASHAPEGDHLGMDVYGAVGTPVLAATGGTVYRSYSEPMYGNQVIIRHGNDKSGARITTIYKHLDGRMVKAGDKVRRGQQIGTLGRTGVLSQSHPHLHFEMWRKPPEGVSVAIDPQFHWVNGPGKVTCYRKGARYRRGGIKFTYPVACKGR